MVPFLESRMVCSIYINSMSNELGFLLVFSVERVVVDFSKFKILDWKYLRTWFIFWLTCQQNLKEGFYFRLLIFCLVLCCCDSNDFCMGSFTVGVWRVDGRYERISGFNHFNLNDITVRIIKNFKFTYVLSILNCFLGCNQELQVNVVPRQNSNTQVNLKSLNYN